MSEPRPRLSLLGTSALLFEAPGETDHETQAMIWALSKEVQSWDGVREAVPGMNNLMINFSVPPRALERWEARLQDTWRTIKPLPLQGRLIEIPGIYGGEGGPHIDDVIAHTGLSIDEIVTIHSAPIYPVYALGSHPGYCYLGGMDARIATPRRKVPVLKIPGGAVSIGGNQTGVSASDGPSGWNTIGTTKMEFFNVERDPPALLAPGDSVKFVVQEVRR